MTETTIRVYDKMPEFIESVLNVFYLANKMAETKKDKRLHMISLVILNYVRKMAADFKVNLKEIPLKELETINLIPIFEYIAYNNVELYDFAKIDINDVDTTNSKDL